jgi:hypothetical protein
LRAYPESGYNVSIVFDVSDIGEDFASLVEQASFLKRNCFASVFEKYFQFQEAGQEGEKRAVIHYREDETMFVIHHFTSEELLFSFQVHWSKGRPGDRDFQHIIQGSRRHYHWQSLLAGLEGIHSFLKTARH